MKRFFLTLLLLVTVVLATGGIFLKKGIHLDSFSAGPATLKNISLEWHSKLLLQIESVVVDSLQDAESKNPSLDLSFVNKVVPLVQWIDRLFTRILVQKVSVGEVTGRLEYEASVLRLDLSSELIDMKVETRLEKGFLISDIQELKSERFHSWATGSVRVDLAAKTGTGTLAVNFADSLPVALSFTMDRKQLSFEGKEAGIITTITPFVDLFGIDQATQKWITDYLTGKRYELKSFSGNFPWKDPLVMLETFLAEVRVDGCQYTFEPGFEAIQSDYADLFFEKGVLVIKPQNPIYYGEQGKDSWLDINFNDFDNILLTAYIEMDVKADQHVVDLLQAYDIPLPFLQTEGKTSVDLTLVINLNTEVVTAKGVFVVDEGRVDYLNANYTLQDARILLDTNKITFEQMTVSYENLFVAGITGEFDAIPETGQLDIRLQECDVALGDMELILDDSKPKPLIHYTMKPDGATIDAGASFWTVGDLPLELGPFTTPFNLDTFSGTIASTSLVFPPFVSTSLSGDFSINEQRANLKCDLLQFQVNDLKLQEKLSGLVIHYDKELTVRSTKHSKWELGGTPVTLYPLELKLSGAVFSIDKGRVSYGTLFDSAFSGQYNFSGRRGEFLLNDLAIKDDTIGAIVTLSELSFNVDVQKKLLLTVPELAMEFSVSEKEKGWKLLLKDLGSLYTHSPLLQKYLVKEGEVSVVSQDGVGFEFSANIPYGYPLFLRGDVPLNRFQIDGVFNEGGVKATINKDIELRYDGGITISSQDLSFNVPAIIKLFKDLPESVEDDSKKQNTLWIGVDALRTSLVLSPERKIIADKITLESSDGKTSGQLMYGAGAILVSSEGNTFSLQGERLNDAFMNALFTGADFHQGTMSVAAKGSLDEFTAMLRVEDTNMKDFTTLNNILAMVNTIPALVTFSLPSYSTNGLPVDSIVIGGKVTNGRAAIETVNVDSPEISILGSGWIDFIQEKIEMDLNLITRAKKNVNKIPLVGYILVGKKKSPSITVQVSGELSDPQVEHSTFKEVAITPFQMLYRTLALPAHLVAPIFDLSTKEIEPEEKENVDWEGLKE